MKTHTYAIIALLSFAGPFALSFDQKVNFIQYLPAILIATASIGALYIIWDIMVTKAGHWRFNDEFVGTKRLLHLPPGEWLFFALIPYACLFIFEVVAAYFGSGSPNPQLVWLQYLLSGIFVILGIIWRKRGYTLLAMSSGAIFMLVSALATPGILAASGFLISMALIYVAFVVINGMYTSLPTIYYSPQATLGLRVGSIPVEDFVYNLSYIGLTLTVYIQVKSLMGL